MKIQKHTKQNMEVQDVTKAESQISAEKNELSDGKLLSYTEK